MNPTSFASTSLRRGPIVSAGVLLGTGLGGFVDGIVLHQILQWHNMLSNWIPPIDVVSIKVNMVWDGLFHALTWFTCAAGLGILWRAGGRPDIAWSTRTFVGSLMLGWGGFNVIEGVIDHHVLALHHVHPGEGQLAWDLGFLGFGALLCGVGWSLVRAGRHDATPARDRAPQVGDRDRDQIDPTGAANPSRA